MTDLLRQKRKFHTPGILLLILGFSGLLWLTVSREYSGRFWQEWYPLLINSSDTDNSTENYLMNVTDGQLISETNSVLRYNGYGSQIMISLEELKAGERMYPSDPRLDPYMKGSIAYFNQGIYKIFYLPSNYSPLRYFWVFSKEVSLKNAEWYLPDVQISTPEILVFVLLILVLCWGSFRFSVSGAAFLWTGGLSVLHCESRVLLVFAVTALFVRLILSGYEKNLWVWIFVFLSCGLAFYWNLIDYPRAVSLFFTAAVATGSFLCVPGVKHSPGRKGQDHMLFEPVPLSPAQGIIGEKSVRRRSVHPVMVAAALLTAVLAVLNFPGVRILPADLPSAVPGEGSWTGGQLNPAGEHSRFPDAEEYLKHRAYQEAFMYGAAYEMPLPGDGVFIDDYGLDNGRISETSRRVVDYSSAWFEKTLQDMKESGPSRLLRSESAPPVIRPQSSIVYGIPLHMLLAFAAFICVYVLIHISGIHPARSRAVRNYGKSFFVLRRKQQAA